MCILYQDGCIERGVFYAPSPNDDQSHYYSDILYKFSG